MKSVVEGVLDLKRGISAKATTVPPQGWTIGHMETDHLTTEDSTLSFLSRLSKDPKKKRQKALQEPRDKLHWPDTTYVFQ